MQRGTSIRERNLDKLQKEDFFTRCVNEYSRPIILEVSRETCSPTKVEEFSADEKRMYLPLHYICTGKGKVTYRGQTCEVSAGDFFLVPPAEYIRYEADAQDPFSYYWVVIAGVAAHQMLNEIGLNKDNVIIKCGKTDDKIMRAFSNLLEYSLEYPKDEYGTLGYFYLLYSAMKTWICHSTERLSASRLHILEIIRFVGRTYMNPKITVDDLCKNLNLSASYVNRIMKKEFGMSPKQYFTFIRIKNACELIAQTDYPFIEIAKLTGYTESRYFSREFKKLTELTPSKYRLQYKRLPDAEMYLREKRMNRYLYMKSEGK